MHWVNLWLQVEALVLRLIKAHGETRNSLSQKMGRGRNYLGRYLRTDTDRSQDEAIEPAFSVAFEVAEYFGLQATSLLAPFETDSFDRLLGMLICTENLETAHATVLQRYETLEKRLCPGLRDDRLLDQRTTALPALGAVHNRLERLERRRHYAPEEVSRECERCGEELVASSDPLSLAESVAGVGLLGIWGSICRSHGRLKAAQEAIQRSLKWSMALSEPTLLANQLQRSSYVFRDLGAPQIALTALRLSGEIFASDGNQIGEVRTFVDRAVMLANQSHLSKADRLYRAALARLPQTGNETYRASAAIGLATSSQIRSDLEQALIHLDQALEESDPRDDCLRAHVLWVAGGIEHQLGLYADAEEKYWQALDLFRRGRRADWVLMTCIDLTILLHTCKKQDGFERIRRLIQEHLPHARHFQDLTGHYEAFLAELISGTTDYTRLEQLRATLRRETRRVTSHPPHRE